MDEVAVLALAFGLGGLLIGGVLGLIGNRTLFLACLLIGAGAVLFWGVQGSQGGGYSSLTYIAYALGSLLGTLVGLGTYYGVQVLRGRRRVRVPPEEDRS